jgi:hypothetical protein
MRYVESCAATVWSGGAAAAEAAAAAPDADADACVDPHAALDAFGEPPTEIAVQNAAELFGELERRLADAHVLQVRGREWLAGDFAREVGARLDRFVARGGRVE